MLSCGGDDSSSTRELESSMDRVLESIDQGLRSHDCCYSWFNVPDQDVPAQGRRAYLVPMNK